MLLAKVCPNWVVLGVLLFAWVSQADFLYCPLLLKDVDTSTIDETYRESWLEFLRDGAPGKSFKRTASLLRESVLENFETIGNLSELGFELRDPRYLSASGFSGFAVNVRKAFVSRGRSDSPRPSLVFFNRETRQTLIVDPLSESIPKMKDGWNLMIGSGARLTPQMIVEAILEDKYPVFEVSLHDVFHFISFLRNEVYWKLLKKAAHFVKENGYRDVDIWRLAFLQEALMTADRTKSRFMSVELLVPKTMGFRSGLPIDDYVSFFRKQEFTVLLKHVRKMSVEYPSYLKSYAAAFLDPYEQYSWGIKPGADYFKYKRMVGKAVSGSYEFGSQTIANIAREVPSGLGGQLRELVRMYDDAIIGSEEFGREASLILGKMEYSLWEGVGYSDPAVWFDEILFHPNPNSSFMNYFRSVWGEDSFTYKAITGFKSLVKSR